MDRRLGLFSRPPQDVNPLAAYEGCDLESHVPQVGPHDIWIRVSCFHFQVQKIYCLLVAEVYIPIVLTFGDLIPMFCIISGYP